MVKCPNCGKTELVFEKNMDTETMTPEGYYYEYDIEKCPSCGLQYYTVIQYDLVFRDHVIIDQVVGEEGK